MLTRSKTARYLASQLVSDDHNNGQRAIKEVAAWLVSNKRQREVKFLEQDIAKYLQEENGYILAKVTTASALSNEQQQEVAESLKRKFQANFVETDFKVDQRLIGGIKIELPDGVLDNTIRRSLAKLIENIG